MQNNYNIQARNVHLGSHGIIEDNGINFNFQNCAIDLQGNLDALATIIAAKGNKEDTALIEHAASALQKLEDAQDPQEVKRSAAPRMVKKMLDELSDEKSTLHQSVKGVKHAVSICQDIAAGYNKIAEWAMLPQVPALLLKSKK